MPIPEDEMLDPGLERRLKAALDAVVPPSPHLSSARYRMGATKGISRAWRFAPALVAMAAAGVAISATAATGSPNPAIWRDRAGTVIQNVSHFPGAGPSPKAPSSPKAEPRETPTGQGSVPAHATPSSGHQPKPTAEPTEPAEPAPSPEPTDQAEPSPTPEPSQGSGLASSPTPDDGGK